MFLATNLAQHVKKEKADLILVDRNSYHQLLQEIHLVAAGFRKADEVKIPISILINGMDIKFIQSEVKEIKPDKSLVILESANNIKYDILIICLGASTKFFNIKGANENTVSLHSICDASSIYDRINAVVESTATTINSDNSKENIAIVGGGATGVSLAGALSDFTKSEKKTDNILLTIIEGYTTILSGWDERLVAKVDELLHKKGVRLITNSLVTKVENDGGIYLKDGGSKIHSSLTIWTAGVKAYDIPINPTIEKTKDGRIIVNEFCQSDQYQNIFSIGDIAAVKDQNGRIYPCYMTF